MAMPLPNITGGAAGPSSAADTGSASGLGSQTVGDFYASGSRRREGLGSQEFLILGALALAGVVLWRKL